MDTGDRDRLGYQWTQIDFELADPTAVTRQVTLTNAATATATFTAPNFLADTPLTFTLTVDDVQSAVTATVIVTVEADDDAVRIGGEQTGSVTEDGAVLARGELTLRDPEGLINRFQAQTDVAGTYGTLDSLTATGEWVYALNNGDDVIQNLRATDMLSETFTVRAEDGTEGSLTITVTGANDAPTATGRFRSDAVIIDSSVTGGSAVSLVGTGTDRDTGEQAALRYQWTQVSGPPDVTLTDADMATATFTAPLLPAETTLVFALTVTDGQAAAIAPVRVRVRAADNSPAVFGGTRGRVTEDGELTATATLTVTDADDPETVQPQADLVGTYGRFTLDAATSVWSYTLNNDTDAVQGLAANEAEAVVERFAVRAADGTRGEVVITVNGANDAPTATATGPATAVAEGDLVTLTGIGSDTDRQDRLRYQWTPPAGIPTSGLLPSATSARITFVAPELIDGTDLAFTLTVTDSSGTATATATATVTVMVTAENDAAVFGGTRTGRVTESSATENNAQRSLAFGLLTVTDSDGPNRFAAQTGVAGTYGTFTLFAAGNWRYDLDNDLSATNALAAPVAGTDLATERFPVQQATEGATEGTVDPAGVVITITGVNDAPTVLAGDDRIVRETVAVTLTGTGTDPESAPAALTYAWTQTGGTPTVTLTNADTATATFTAPDLTEDMSLTFTLTVTDPQSAEGTDTVVIVVDGVANRPASITGDRTGTVTEDAPATVVNGQLAVSDTDDGDSTDVQLQGDSLGTYGTFTVATGGRWTYTLDNADDDTNALAGGDRGTERFTVATGDGTEVLVAITVIGADDLPTAITGQTTGRVTEDADVAETTGMLAVTDPDGPADAAAFQAQGSVVGIYGTFTLAANGEWTYTLDNADPETNALAADATATDVFTAVAADDTGLTQVITITITGAAAPVVVGGQLTGSVTEDEFTDDGFNEINGFLSATDPDNPGLRYTFRLAPGDFQGTYGTFTLGGVGPPRWRYRLDNADPDTDLLTAGETGTDTFTLTVEDADGTRITRLQDEDGNAIDTLAVTITIVGANDAPTIIGALTGAVTEDSDEDRTTGLLTVTAVDNADLVTAFTVQADVPGTYGSFTLTEGGAWTYTLDNADPETNALAAGVTRSDVFTVVFAADTSVTQAVTITVTGANDAPTADAGASQSVFVGATVTLAGRGTDPDTGDSIVAYTWTQSGSPTVILSDATVARPTFTAPDVMSATALTFALVVNDGEADSDRADTVTITVFPGITGDTTGMVTEDATVTTATGVLDNPIGGFDAQDGNTDRTNGQGAYGRFTLATDGVWTYTLDNAAADTNALPAGATVTDIFTAVSNMNAGVTQAVTITVTGANDAPTALPGDDDRTVPQEAMVTLSGRGTDPDTGDQAELTYAWTQTGGTPTVTLAPAPGAPATGVTFTAPMVGMDDTPLTFTLTVTDRQGAADTAPVMVTIDADSTASDITGDIFGFVTEDADTATATGILTVTAGGTVGEFQAQPMQPTDPPVVGVYGTFTLAATGAWTYTLDNEDIDTDALSLGPEEIQETFRVVADDMVGTPVTVTIFINGANDRPTVMVAPTQTVGEETIVTLTGTGDDVDAGDMLRYRWTQSDFELADPTAVTRQVALTNADTATATFTAPNFLEDTPLTFTLTVADVHSAGVTATVIVTVTADDDPVLIGGEQTGSVTEDGAVLARGELTIRDPDGHDRFRAQTAVAGAYGTLASLTAPGVWVYALNNGDDVVQNLRATDVRTETFTVQAEDDTRVSLTITVTGANDAPTATGRFRSDAVIIDSSVTGGSAVSLVGTGTDRDTGEQAALRYQWTQVSGQPDVTLTDADMATATFTAPLLPAETTLVFALTVTDGQAAAIAPVRVLVRAADNIPAVFSGTRGRVTEDGELTATDTLTVTDADPDDPETIQAQDDDLVGAYGTFTLNAATGVWSYTLNNDTDAVQGLAANEAVRERFAVRAADGTRGEVVITVNGANDAPTATATGPATAVAEGDLVTLTGTGTDPDRQDRLRYQWTPPAGIPTIGLLPSATSAIVTFVAPELIDGTDLAFTLTVTDPSEVTATATVTVMVTADDDAAVFGGTHTGSVTESSATENNAQRSLAFGLLTVTDSDGPNRFAAQTGVAGTYGTFTLFAAGNWRYDLDDDLSATNALAAPVAGTALATESFPVQQAIEDTIGGAEDPAGVVITITGVNDAPTVLAGDDRIVRENVAVTLTGTGTDPETSAPAALTYAWTQTGGTPTVTLTNADTATATFTAPDLTEDMPLTFTLTVTDPQSAEGTDTVVIVVDGVANRPAIITGDRTGTVTEDAPATVANGQLEVFDSDNGDSTDVQLQGGPLGLGTYGTFTVATGGLWTYTLNNADPETNALAGGDRGTERFTVATGDGTEVLVAITVIGADDLPTAITGQTTGRVTEDADVAETTGTLTVTDPDGPAGAAAFQAQGRVVGIYGTFTLAANGGWTYTLDNADPETNALAADATATDVFTAVAADDTTLTQVITITITGAAAPVVVGGQLTGSTTEDEFTDDGFNEINGFLSATDPDNPGLRYTFRLAPGDFQGTYGTFTLGGVGPPRWRYRLDNADPDTDLLTAGETGTDTFTLTVEDADGTRITLLQDEDGNAIDTLAVTITIVGTDDALPVISIAAVTSPVTEGTAATFTLTASSAPVADLTVRVTVTDPGNFIAGPQPTMVTIAASATTATLTVPTTPDNADEADDTITVEVAPNAGYTVGDPATASVRIDDDDDVPTLAISSSQPPDVEEGDDSESESPARLIYTVTLTGETERTVTVEYGTSGTATENTDYRVNTGVGMPGRLTFAPDTTSRTIEVLVTGDTIDEDDETVIITLSNPDNATITTAAGTGTGTITDDDTLSISIVAVTPSVTEGTAATFMLTTVTADPAPATALTVMVSVTDSGNFLAGPAPTMVTIAAGETTALLTVETDDDSIGEANGMITATVTAGIGYTADDPPATAEVTITDNDVPTLAIDSPSVREDAAGLTYTVTLTRAREQTVTVGYAVTDGTATADADYTAVSTTGTLTFTPGGTLTQTIEVTVTDDSIDETDETVIVTLSTPVNATITTATGTGTITNDDADPVVTLVLTPATIAQSGGVSTVTAMLDRASSAPTTVTVSATPVSPAVAGDYNLSDPSMLTIVAGATSSTGLVTVTAVNRGATTLREVTVSATVVNDNGFTGPDDQTLSIVAAVPVPGAVLVGTLTEATLNGATVTVTLENTAYVGSLSTDNFTLTPQNVPGVLRVNTVSLDSNTEATLTLAYDGTDLTANGTLSVTVLDSGHTGSGDLTTDSVPILAITDGITGATTGTVTEDDPLAATANGQLTLAGDFVAQTDATATTGTYGTFDLTAAGAWTYMLNNDDPETNALAGGTQVTDVFTAVSADDASETQAVTITVTGANDAPTANAGADQPDVLVGATVTLDGRGSTDPDTDGRIATYAWTQRAGPEVTLSATNVARPTFTAPSSMTRVTALTFELIVNDGSVDSAADTVTIITMRPLPGLVQNFTADPAARGGRVILRWEAPFNAVVADVTHYELQSKARSATAFEPLETLPVGSTTTQFVLPRRTSVTSFEFRIRALAAGAVGDWVSTDGPSPGALLSVNTLLEIAEGGTATYTVVLQTVPTAPVTVAISSDNDDVTATGLTFTVANWNIPQAVIVTAAQDADGSDDVGISLTHVFDGGGYRGVSARVDVNVVDDDPTFGTATIDAQIYTVGMDIGSVILPTATTGTGALTYTLTPLPAGLTLTDNMLSGRPETPQATTNLTYTVTDSDGNTDTIGFTVTINVSPGITGDTVGVVTEGGAAVTTIDTATGRLFLPGGFEAQTGATGRTNGQGAYGSFTLTTAGVWTYALNNADLATNELAGGVRVTDVFTAVSADDASETQAVTITVTGANDAPTADAGASQSVFVGATVTLAGRGTDPDTGDSIAAYAWTQSGSPTVILSDATVARPTFTAPDVMSATALTFALVVNDGEADSDRADTVTITVFPGITGDTTGMVTEDATVTTATGVLDNPIGGFEAQAGASDRANGQGAYGRFTLVAGGAWTYTLDNAAADTDALPAGATVTDIFTAVSNMNAGVTQAVTITVTGANDAPSALPGDDRTVPQEAMVNLSGRGTDPDTGDQLTYAWTQTGGTPTVTLAPAPGAPATGVTFTAPMVDGANTTLTFTLTVTDRQGAADTAPVMVTIDADSTASDITGDIFGGITEDAEPNTATGALTVTDAGGDMHNVMPQTVPGPYGTFTLAATGAWTYTLNNEAAVTDALPSGAEIQETFRVVADDMVGTPVTVTIFINGANDRPTVVVEPEQTVNEETPDGAATLVTLTGTGDDVDTGDRDRLGYQWTQIDFELADPTAVTRQVTLTNADTATATFTAPNFIEPTPLTFTLTVADVLSAAVTATVIVTVDADNDPVRIGGEQTGSVTEDGAVLARGELTIRDPDGHDRFRAQTAVAGDYGTLASLTATGVWVYALNNGDDVVQNLRATDVRTETFTVQAEDNTPVSLTITVTGANDAPTARGRFRSDAVIIDSSVTGGSAVSLVGTGTDRDTGEQAALRYAWRQVSGQPDVTLTDADMATATFTAPLLPAETTLVFELTVTDGQAAAIAPVRVLVRAADNIPAVFGGTRGRVTEDGEQTATDTLTVTDADPDDPETIQAQDDDLVGTYGRFTLDAATGVWSYTLNNDTDAVQGLAANEAVVERFAVQAADGTRGEVVITVNGANDAPTATATGPATAEEGTTVTLTGTGSDPDRQDRLRYQWTPPAGIPTIGLLPSATSAIVTFVAPELIDGTDLAFTLTVTDPSDVTATATVTVMVTADDDAAVFGGTHTGSVTESSATENNAQESLAFGLLTVTDADGPNRFEAQTGVAGTYGTFTLFAAGNWRYDLDNDLPATNALAAPVAGTALATERFLVRQATEDTIGGAEDPADVIITITGVNDAPTVLAGDDRIVRENVAVTLTGTGTDPESAPAALTYAWTQTGTPTVTLTNVDTATATFTAPDLTANTRLTFTLTVTDPQSAEGTDTVVIVVTALVNRPAIISGDRTGTVTEDAPATVANGQLEVFDSDDGDSTDVQLQGGPLGLGTYGTFTVATGGLWTYTLDNEDDDTNALAGGDRGTERFTVETGDGTEVLVAITVIGADDLPTAITGQTTGRVTEDAVVVETTGTLAVTDPDGPAGAAAFQAQGSVVGIYGTFTLAANGEWTYTLDNADPETNALAADATATDVFTAVAADDTTLTQVITITITGAAAPVVVGGQLTGSTTEDEFTDDGFNEINGFLSATDPDNPGLRYTFRLAPGDFQGTYGTFTLGGVGPPRWRYRLDNADPDTDLLTAGETVTDTFTLTVEDADGTRITLLQDEDGNAIDTLAVTITIVGTDDPPTISGALTGAVTEDSDEDRTTGLLTVTAVDNADLVTAFTEQADVPGTYGSFTLTEGGAWTYTLDNADPETNALAAGVTRSDVFTVVFAADTSVTQAVTITVTGANDAPTADAGASQSVFVGATVTLAGRGTDPDTGDSIVAYTWTQSGSPTVTLSDATVARPTFTAPDVMSATTLTFALVVNDGEADSDRADTVTITVFPGITGDTTGMVTEDATVTTATGVLDNPIGGFEAQAGASDRANGQGAYGSFTLATDGAWTYTLDNAAADTDALPAGATVTDIFTAVSNMNAGVTQAVTITVTGANDAPTALPGDDRTVPREAMVNLSGRGTDPDTGDQAELTYAWTQTGGTPTVTLAPAPGAPATGVTFTAPEVDANTPLTFTLTVTDRQGAADTAPVMVTINAGSTASDITGDIFGLVTEDAEPNTATGALTVTDVDNGTHNFVPQTVTGPYGTFTLADSGAWTYTLDNAAAVTDALPSGSEIQETFRVVAADTAGTPATVTIFINGANDRPTVVVAPTQMVNEETPDGAATLVTLTGTGDDVDTGDRDRLGYQWTQIDFELADPTAVTRQVTLTNADTATATFTAPNFIEPTPLTFTLTVDDVQSAVTATVIVTVTADDDPVRIGGEQTGSVTEDGATLARGELTIRDPDGHDRFQAQTDVAGTYGTLDSLTATGVWVYALNNGDDVIQNLRATDVLSETFTVRAEDGTEGSLTITVTGANDAPTATGRFRSDAVIIDSSVTGGSAVSLVGTGTDRDTGEQEALRYAWTQVSGQPDVTLTDANTATATFTAPLLPAETTLVFALTVTDGQAAAIAPVRVLVRAADNIPAVFGGTRGRVTEDGELTATDTLTVTDADPDDPETIQAQDDDLVGAYGTFTLNAATGVWSYTLNNDTDAVQGLAANEAEAVVERFAVRAADGTRGEVVITVNGANDAPTATATGPATAVAEGDLVTLTGTGSDPDRQDRLRYQWMPPAGIPTIGLLPSATSAIVTFVAPELIDGTDLAFTLTVTDPSEVTATATVTVMVTADDDAAVFGGTRTGRVTESSATENNAQRSLAFGLLTVTDSDGPNRFEAQTGVAGTYGTFTLFAAGNWRYDLDNDLPATNALAAPVLGTDLATESFPVQQATEDTIGGAEDPERVVITITGVNDAPTALAGDDRIVRETVAVTLTGTGTDRRPAPRRP